MKPRSAIKTDLFADSCAETPSKSAFEDLADLVLEGPHRGTFRNIGDFCEPAEALVAHAVQGIVVFPRLSEPRFFEVPFYEGRARRKFFEAPSIY